MTLQKGLKQSMRKFLDGRFLILNVACCLGWADFQGHLSVEGYCHGGPEGSFARLLG
jgi:hypothetical protein